MEKPTINTYGTWELRRIYMKAGGTSARKPHSDFAGYVAELRNRYSGGHTIISDCKLAVEQGVQLAENWTRRVGRYQVLCNEHSQLVYTKSLPVARGCMKDPTIFCTVCRRIAGEGDAE